ncbi:hypothetical protein [Pseudomonas sp.]|uniref:hypothetical protein n=1 Tax=Pseudomonas sp. TaxID=306 RepID=UPI0028A04F49|nr:hypothetical protein [Pseudomonas sp.]
MENNMVTEHHQITSIAIVDMLPDGERGTARRLEEHLTGLQARQCTELNTYRLRISSADQFLTMMDELASKCARGEEVPMLHLEAHGSPSGLLGADGKTILWRDVACSMTRINKASGHNLIVVMSTCYGFWLHTTLNIHAPAPFAILIAPNSEVTVAQVELATERFYEGMSAGLNLTEAFDRYLPHHQYLSSLGFFWGKWSKAYSPFATSRKLTKVREGILTYALQRADVAPRTARARIKELVVPELTLIFERSQQAFFHGETPLSLADLERQIKR